jgi:uncharacterized protein
MKFKAIKGLQGSGTEVKGATSVEAAGWGKYRWWRYLLGLVVILFAWLIVGTAHNSGDGSCWNEVIEGIGV